MALSAAFVNVAARGNAKPRKYFDDGGLFLKVAKGGSASWVFRYERGGTRREIGLGGLGDIGLADARNIAAEHRRTLAHGGEPVAARRQAAAAMVAGTTFAQAVDQFLAAHEAAWKNMKHRAQWWATLDTYAAPVLGNASVASIDAPQILKVLKPIWSKKPETASRLRGRIERILDWAKVQGLRDGENPARWRGHLAHMLPKKSAVHRVEHHAAVPVSEISEVYASLCDSDGTAALAVRFNILCAARPGETAGATWDEVDRPAKVWTVPPERMKRGIEHRVPLTDEALAVLDEAAQRRQGKLVFPGGRKTRGQATALSLASMAKALRRAGAGDATTHGTSRSTFDDWATERGTNPALVDRALAHREKSATVAAYRRTDLLEQRRPLMTDWASFLKSEC